MTVRLTVPLPRSLLALGLIVSAVTMLGIPAHATYGARVTADEPQYLLTALSIAEDADLDIADELADERYRTFHRVDLPRQTHPFDDGRELSPHDPLLPLLLAIPMRVGGWIAAKAMLAVLAGLLAALTAWVASERFGVRRGTAWWFVLAASCSAPLATYATQVYPEVPAALAVTVAVAVLTGPLDRRGQRTLVAAVTALAWLSVKYAPVGVALVGVGVWRLRGRRRDGASVVGLCALSALVFALAHQRIYHGLTPYAAGNHFVDSGELSVVGSSPHYVGRVRRATGLLVDDSFGIAAWAPMWLLLPGALGALARRRPRGAAALVAPLAVGWSVATFVALTMHGWWWPGRQLVVVLPLALIVIAVLIDRTPWLHGAVLAAAVLGVLTWAWTTIEAIGRRRVLVVDFDHTANPWYRLWRHLLPDGRRAHAIDDVGLVLWTLALGVSAVVGWWSARDAATPTSAPITEVRRALPFRRGHV